MVQGHGAGADWQRLLAAQRRLQEIVPGTVLVGGTAAALHAAHRVSLDGDHILVDLKGRFDAVLETLEAVDGWKTNRIERPVMILGQFDGFLTGLRQLRRSRPLDVMVIQGLRVPTLEEMARIKAWLLLDRDTTRDFLDTVVLLDLLGEARLETAFCPFDEIYNRGPGAGPPTVELADRLAAARPADLPSVDLHRYKDLVAPWNDWGFLQGRARHWAGRLADLVLGKGGARPPQGKP